MPQERNDDFGARYYSSRLSRWLSPDWSAIPAPVPYANLTNPQTLNLYAMVSDNPETFADLDGHDSICWICLYEAAKKLVTSPGVEKMAGSLGVKVAGGVGVEYGVRSPWGNFTVGAALTGEVSASKGGITVDAVAEATAKGKIGSVQGEVKGFSVKDTTLQNGQGTGNQLTVKGPSGEVGGNHTEVTGESGEIDLGVTASASGGVASLDITIDTKQFSAGFDQLLKDLGADSTPNLPKPQN